MIINMVGSQVSNIPTTAVDNESNLNKNLTGILTIIKREFIANLKNFRMGVLIFIFIFYGQS